jgi:hypothetical protein
VTEPFKATDWRLPERVRLQITASLSLLIAFGVQADRIVPTTDRKHCRYIGICVLNSEYRQGTLFCQTFQKKLMSKPPFHFHYQLIFDKCRKSTYTLSHLPALQPNPNDNRNNYTEEDVVQPLTASSTSYNKRMRYCKKSQELKSVKA